MKTEIIKGNIQDASEIISRGGLVAVPTETVYGLAGNGLNEAAVKEIYEVKGRPEVKPLSLMVPDAESMERYCEDVPESAKFLAQRFWPGPLTIVLKSKDIVPEIVRAGGETVGLRCPDHLKTLELLEMCGLPLAAPSANPSGSPSPKTAEQVREYFDGKIDGIIDGGECNLGTESTLILMTQKPYKILRQGALSREEIAKTLAGRVTRVGITGGTGCGKTTALNTLKEMGALIIDCDEVYHRLLIENMELIAELSENFPGTVTDGELDRKALGRDVFSDSGALLKLNAITHRYVGEKVEQLIREHAMCGGTLAAIDAVELISSGLSDTCKLTVGVTSSRERRIERIMERDGITREYAEMRVDAQHSEDYYRQNCTAVLENNGTIDEFNDKCKLFFMEALNK